jgi:class 3 adenylate cyclase/FixJ family two-component response regulator
MAEISTHKIKKTIIDKLSVWVIEDDKVLNKTICRSLVKEGFLCHGFFSGQQLIEYVKTSGSESKVIMLIDYLLEDMDAFELLRLLKEMEVSNPYVVMTGFGDEKIAVELMKSGAMDYIVKEEKFVSQLVKVLYQVIEKIDMNEKLEISRQELRTSAEKLRKLNEHINLQKLELENEKAKTDKLLHTILPGKIAQELLEKGYTRPRQYEIVSILFADVIGFSDLAKKGPPIELVSRLDNYFYVFDEIVEQFGLEKIKTIGDCYMCAGGIPDEDNYNPVKTVLAGLKIQKTSQLLKDEFNSHFSEFRLRLGIHTGEVVAGVVGKNKFVYDIWGDAVNIASRIVEAGEENKVNISEQTYSHVKDYFIFTKRGEVVTKRNVPIKMYFVERLRPEFAADEEGITPNKNLLRKLHMGLSIKYY